VITALNCLLVHYGAGRHIQTMSLDDIKTTIKLGFATRITYQVCLMTTKISICLFYYRIFQDRWSKVFVWTMIAFLVLFTIPLTFALMFRCRPFAGRKPSAIYPFLCKSSHVSGAWSLIPTKCRSDEPYLYAGTILNVIADIALLVFVVPKISES
jgi:hypothetical protein